MCAAYVYLLIRYLNGKRSAIGFSPPLPISSVRLDLRDDYISRCTVSHTDTPVKMASRCNELPWPDLAAYFEFKSKNGENIVVACKLCPRGPKTLSANVKASSNLRKHLQVSLFISF